jgi:C-terminal processing protease CtpA/Prc
MQPRSSTFVDSKEVAVELRSRPASIAIAVAIALAAAPPRAFAEPLPDQTERVLGLGRVWAKVKFYHPYLAYKDIDWDAALLAALPKVEAAATTEDYRKAVQGMLAALSDPVTRVSGAPAQGNAQPPADWLTTPSPGVLEVKLAAFTAGSFDYVAMQTKSAQVANEAAKAKVMIVDMRAANPDFAGYATDRLADAFPAIEEWPLERTVEHHGFRTQDGWTSGGYYSTFVTSGARPPKAGPKAGPSHVVFVLDPDSVVPGAALALQAAGRATIVAPGALDEERVVSTMVVELPGKLTVHVRLGELLWGAPTADVVAPAKDLEARARAAAKTLAAATARPKAKPRQVLALPPLRTRDDLDYADQPYPSRERRLLAGIRLWAVIDNFFPYRYLITDWEGALRDTLPRLAAAPDRDAYRKVLRQLSVRAGDGHIGLRTAAPDPAAKLRGALPAIATRLVEGKLAVTRLLDAAEARKHGLALGDVVETIDGKPLAKVLADARPDTSGSTDEARDQRIAAQALAGEDGTTVRLGIRGADGKPREVTLSRSTANLTAMWQKKSAAAHWRRLPDNVGYVDLTELLVPEIAPMFDELRDTRAIIFDLRGYPNGTAWAIAPRINTKQAKHGAQFLRPIAVGNGGEQSDMRVRFLQQIPPLPRDAWLYTGKIVVLIDDRAISQSEHTCLFFQAAAGATFVGSPTHGANGDVTVMRLPGGLRMSFTGQEVRHVDGRQLQRVGIQPDVVVRPTIAGVRAGKDEVLDRALAWLAKK